jgi:hypothetical protein
MATLVNRDWYTVNASGLPMKVRCLSQNYVLGTVRVVTDDGVFAEIDARELHRSPEDVLTLVRRNDAGEFTTIR